MVFLVCFRQTLRLHMGIDFRCADIGMPQKHLDRPEIRAALKKMRGERMPKGMR